MSGLNKPRPRAGAAPVSTHTLMSFPSAASPANCVVLGGLPWQVSEVECRQALLKFGYLRFARLYEDPINGSSRGMVLVQFSKPEGHENAVRNLKAVGPYPVTLTEYVVHSLWDSTTAPPPIPNDSLKGTVSRGKPFGFGPKCLMRAVGFGDANTISVEGTISLETARKKWRSESDDAPGMDFGGVATSLSYD